MNSASLVGFSGGLRFYLAFLLAGVAPNLLLVVAASLIIYATYTLDRSLDNKEDEVNHKEFMGASKTAGLAASAIALMVGISLFFSKQLFSPPVFPFIVGILYSRGIPVGKRCIKLKGGSGIKNLVIGITWGGTIGLVVLSTGMVTAALVIAIYFGMKLFINSTIFDLKDVEGDLAAGIRTLPIVLGEKKLKYLLFAICIVQHMIIVVAMMTGILAHAGVFLAYSFIVSGAVILYYSPTFESDASWLRRKFRILAINGEPIALVALSIVLPY
ncbi:MAG: UbiA family prenyltransferase [Patulibacter sp.]